jgi:hypothetical protein
MNGECWPKGALRTARRTRLEVVQDIDGAELGFQGTQQHSLRPAGAHPLQSDLDHAPGVAG